MKIFNADYLHELTSEARGNPRKRQHCNIHECYEDPCQRLFNAIELSSYIRPHRHASDPRDDLLVAIRGLMALLTFDDNGTVINVLRLGKKNLVQQPVRPRRFHRMCGTRLSLSKADVCCLKLRRVRLTPTSQKIWPRGRLMRVRQKHWPI